MGEEVAKYRETCLSLCAKLLSELKRNQEDADLFFGGEIYKSYIDATDKAINKAGKVQTKIRNI